MADAAYEALRTTRAHALGGEEEGGWISVRNELIAGSLSGVAGVVSGHPFDLIKVRVQAARDGTTNPVTLLSRLLKNEGVGALFKGVGPPVASQAFLNAITFGTFEAALRAVCPGQHRTDAPLAALFIAGFIGGFVQSFILSPFELVKCRLQVQDGAGGGAPRYKGGLDCVRQLVREGGVRNMARGLPGTLWREAPSFGIYFGSYEFFIRSTRTMWGERCYNHIHVAPSERPAPPMLVSIVAGGLAGSCSWLSTYPADVIKSRIQLSDTVGESFWGVGRKIVAEEGVATLFRGSPIAVMRAFPANGVIFTSYEMIQQWFNNGTGDDGNEKNRR